MNDHCQEVDAKKKYCVYLKMSVTPNRNNSVNGATSAYRPKKNSRLSLPNHARTPDELRKVIETLKTYLNSLRKNEKMLNNNKNHARQLLREIRNVHNKNLSGNRQNMFLRLNKF